MTRPIRRILVAIKDVRAGNAAALKKAAKLARALGAKVELFHAMTEAVPIDAFMYANQGLRKFETDAQARCLRRLESLAGPLRRHGLAVSTAAEWDYPAHEAVLRQAHRTKADLIIALQHAKRHIIPVFLRYTDWELLRRSPVPVLLLKSTRPYESPRVLAAIDPAHAFEKTARLDHEILGLAGRLAAALRGRLHVIHTYVPTLIGMNPALLATPDATGQITSRAAGIAQRGVDKALRAARLGQLAPERRHVLVAHAVDAIPALARKLQCDLVVMGAVSRTGLKRLAIGNTAEGLVDDLPCDLLIVKSPAFVPPRISTRPNGPRHVVLSQSNGTI